MKKVALVFSSDYELFGDGSGNVSREQIKPTNDLVNIFSENGAKLTVMFEYGQYLIYEKFSSVNPKFEEDNKKIREQLINLIMNGHDVQLHYHSQWRGATYDIEKDKFNLNLTNVDISCLEYTQIVEVLRSGKSFLENLLKPYKKDYECVAFRAGSWAVKNEIKLARALKKVGFKLDSSVVPNTKFESEHVNFEYKNSPHQYNYWFCENDLSTSTLNGSLIEMPIYTLKSPFASLKYLNSKYNTSRKMVKSLYTQKISEVNFSFFSKVKKVITRDYYMADLNTMSSKTLIKMVEHVIKNDDTNRKVIPIMFIAHSKVSYALDDLKKFFEYFQNNYQDKIEYWTIQETIINIGNGLNPCSYIKNVKTQIELLQYNFSLPIFGQEDYLKVKSNDYGWFVSCGCVLPYFIDKRGMFSRMVFTTNVISSDNEIHKQTFLDNTIKCIKEHKLCDFIYKAQANVVFDVCPKKNKCVPWGTYEVDLDISNDALFNSFNGKARNAIRRAHKEGVEVVETQDVYLVYKNIKDTLMRQASAHYPSLEYIEKLVKLKDHSKFFIAKKDDNIQGSLILLYDEYAGYAMYAGSIKKPLLGSLDLLHFKAMSFLQTKGIKKYDFVGTRINIKKGSKQEGIDKFKRKFNPTLRSGYAFSSVIRPFKYQLYLVISKFYFILKGIKYEDPIIQIMNDEKPEKNILILGPRLNNKNAQLVGGPIVLFEELIKQFDRNNITYVVIDTNKKNYKNAVFAYILIILSLFVKSWNTSHISLHSSNDYKILAPIVIFTSKLYGITSSLRKFGGEAKDTYTKAANIQKKVFDFIFSKVDYLFLETKYLVNFFSKINKNTYWFPNVRNRLLTPQLPRKFNKKFVFISHVIREKGIEEIVEAVQQLDDSYTVDIYGPLLQGHYNKENFENRKVRYKGALPSDRVLSTLNQYDVVLLPSYKEGYPGIVIEAYSLGMPVITTNLPSISEIIDDYETGILVNPKNVVELKSAIEYFNEDNYRIMSDKAYRKFDNFKSDLITKEFIKIIHE